MSERERDASSLASVEPVQTAESGSAPQISMPCSDNFDLPLASPPRREPGQATLSTISEVTVAAAETLNRGGGPNSSPASEKPETSRAIRWLIAADFFLIAYVLSCGFAIYALASAPWTRVFLAPLFPVVVGTLAFDRLGRWKSRAQDWKFEIGALRNATDSLGHEAANGVNAIRANLLAFRLANPQVSGADHLEEIELACRRIESAVEKSDRTAGWKGA